MVFRGSCLLFVSLAFAVLSATPAAASDATPDFGDDDGEFSRDGECDDMRFEGPGMTSTSLLDGDVGHDATDCRVAFEQGRLTVNDEDLAVTASINDAMNRIQWGDDSSPSAEDGACDDMRFTGPGMTGLPLLASDVQHDAADCRLAYREGRLSLQE